MNTFPALQITDSGEVNLIPEYPVKPDNFDCTHIPEIEYNYKKAVEQALLTAIPVKNKECVVDILSNQGVRIWVDIRWQDVTGIYPYNGDVKEGYEFKTGNDWYPCSESQYLGFLNNGKSERVRKVAILVEKTEVTTEHCGGISCPFEYSCVDGCMYPRRKAEPNSSNYSNSSNTPEKPDSSSTPEIPDNSYNIPWSFSEANEQKQFAAQIWDSKGKAILQADDVSSKGSELVKFVTRSCNELEKVSSLKRIALQTIESMKVQIDRKSDEVETLRTENKALKEEIEEYQGIISTYITANEHNRIEAKKDAESIKELVEAGKELMRYKSEIKRVMKSRFVTPETFIKAIDEFEVIVSKYSNL